MFRVKVQQVVRNLTSDFQHQETNIIVLFKELSAIPGRS